MDEIEDDKTRLHVNEGVQSELFETEGDSLVKTMNRNTSNGTQKVLESSAMIVDNVDLSDSEQFRIDNTTTYDRVRIAEALLREEGIEIDPRLEAIIGKLAKSWESSSNQERKRRNPEEARKQYEWSLSVYRGSLMLQGFREEVMPLPIFYEDASRWVEVCGEKDYPLQEKAIGILETRVGEMLEIVTPEDSTKVRIYDFGVGNGVKKGIVDDQAIAKNGRHIESHGVDSSREMLYEWLSRYAKDKIHELLEIKKDRKAKKPSKWKEMADFLGRHNLNYSDHPESVDRKLKIILEKYFDKDENFDLLKHFFARMLSLKLSIPKERAMIEELDSKVSLPITLHAHPKWFQALDPSEFVPGKHEGVVIYDLGSEVCNRFPGQSVDRFCTLLSPPDVPESESGIIPLSKEKNTRAGYAVMGLQLGEIPRSQEHFRQTRTRMRKPYNNSPFIGLTTDPFKKDDLSYIDSKTGKKLRFNDIGFLYVDYEEDPKHPGYYMATHRLYITEDVAICNKEGDVAHIPGKEQAENLFKRTVEALFDPEREEEVGGRRKEVLRALNISTKEELLNIDINRFFSRDYSHYWSGVKIAEDVLGEPNNLEQTLLYPSYKPSLEQMVTLCHKRGLKVIDVYKDNKDDPTYVKILTRKMTPQEKAMYDSGNIDEKIFYTIKKKSKRKQRSRANRKGRKKARKSAEIIPKKPPITSSEIEL